MSKRTAKVEQPVHGAFDYAELESLGLHPEEVIDFSVNSNPYGPSPRVREAVANVALDRYPDRTCLELKRAILDYELDGTRLPLAALVCGNGTAELIWTIAHASLKPGMKVAIIGPTFGEYHTACLAMGATIIEYRACASMHFQPDSEEIATWIGEEHPSLVWLCNPNNPTGTWIGQEEMFLVAEACQKNAAMLVVDEAYWRFVSPREEFSARELIEALPGLEVVVLRSLTKDFSLAGLRLGYAIATEETARRLNAHLPSWNVNGVAQAAGVAALSDRVYLETTLQALMTERTAFFQALVHGNLKSVPSRTHFCLLAVENAHNVRQQLLTRKMLVRDCTSFGLPHCIRIATRSAGEWQGLLAALQEMNI
ncbi:MAG: histidinol-phosphate aminotransferase family protein [Ktedonobacteraceae bacterium]|nr:histidinol-phosphate aminotransferase family protein [Ktedonobacteraceae bacterium]